jgi:hypothetical protein
MKTKLLSLLVGGMLISSSAMAQFASFPFDANIKDANAKVSTVASASGLSFVTDETRGKVVELDGTNGYFTMAAAGFSADAITINMWFNQTNAGTWWVRLFDFGDAAATGDHDVNFMTTFGFGKLQWNVHALAWNTNGKDTILASNDTIRANRWYMVTAVQSGDSVKMYVDGVLNSKKACAVKPNTMTFANLNFGKSNWADALFSGRFDEFTIWKKELTQAEITALYTKSPINTAVNYISNDKIKVYASNKNIIVDLNGEKALVSVYDITGRVVVQPKAAEEVKNVSLKSGVYVVRVAGASTNYSAKVVVE